MIIIIIDSHYEPHHNDYHNINNFKSIVTKIEINDNNHDINIAKYVFKEKNIDEFTEKICFLFPLTTNNLHIYIDKWGIDTAIAHSLEHKGYTVNNYIIQTQTYLRQLLNIKQA